MPAEKTTTPKRRSSARKVKQPDEITYPSPQAIEDARKRRKTVDVAQGVVPGTVLGLSDEWVAAVMDPSLPEGARSRTAASWISKGWGELEGLHTAAGYHGGAIVFVKTKADYQEARRERANKIEAARRAGRMHRR